MEDGESKGKKMAHCVGEEGKGESCERFLTFFRCYRRPCRTGLGRLLMGFLETIGKNVPSVEKVMLTCFLANEKGIEFYERIGFAKDEISPVPRTLRFGKVFNPDYMIMSKVVKTSDT